MSCRVLSAIVGIMRGKGSSVLSVLSVWPRHFTPSAVRKSHFTAEFHIFVQRPIGLLKDSMSDSSSVVLFPPRTVNVGGGEGGCVSVSPRS